ncbi:MAG: YbhB/YbcL family Raf kinase inhibitor-like protein [Chitinophagales bacterium]
MKNVNREIDYKVMRISSKAFENNEFIPVKYTCDGLNVSPPLDIDHVPLDARSLAIIVDDPDAPTGIWVHWVIWNIPITHHVKENEAHGIQGTNDFRKHGYGGPCPPNGTHRYFFKIYALDRLLDLHSNSGKAELEKAMSGHILGFGELIGLYARRMRFG